VDSRSNAYLWKASIRKVLDLGGRIDRPVAISQMAKNGGTWVWCEKPEPLESMKKYCSSSTPAGNVIHTILPKAEQG